MLDRQETKFTPVNAYVWGAIATICLVVIMLFGGSFLHAPSTSGPGVWEYSIFLSPFMCIALMSVMRAKVPVKKALESKPMRFLGKISYSLYLTHFFIFVLCYDFHIPRNFVTAVLIGLFAVAFAWVLYKAVELPLYKIGVRLSNRLMSVS
jgi:peptidoglycan/LPS O-acetylase OafA/YrhL